MVWQWTQLSREEPRGLQQIVCRLNSTTCPQGPNNRKTLRNTHCCSDCHIPQIINCQGSCHPPPTPSPSSSSLFFLSPSLSHSAASRWCAGAQLVPHYYTYSQYLSMSDHILHGAGEGGEHRVGSGRMRRW